MRRHSCPSTVGHCSVCWSEWQFPLHLHPGFLMCALRCFADGGLFGVLLWAFKIVGTFNMNFVWGLSLFFLNKLTQILDWCSWSCGGCVEVWSSKACRAHLVAYWAHPVDSSKSLSLLVLAALSQAFAVHDAHSLVLRQHYLKWLPTAITEIVFLGPVAHYSLWKLVM